MKKIFKLESPGHMLAQTLKELGVSQYRFAHASGIDRAVLHGICAGTRRITAENAVRIARTLGTDAQSWLNAQAKFDLWQLEQHAEKFSNIEPLTTVA